MTKQTTEEQIILYSPVYSDQTEEINLNRITLELLQTSRLREYQQLCRIFDDKFLNVNQKKARNTRGFTVPLSLLDEQPVRKWFIRFRYLLLAIMFFLLAWTAYTLMQQHIGIFNHPNTYAAITLLLTVGAIFIVLMIKQSRHVLIFKSRHGQIPLLELMRNNPDKYRYRQFAAQLRELIARSDTQNHYSESQRLAAELSEHRRLRNEGILTDKQYEQVKQNIMARHSRPTMRSPNETIH
ncbi:MAG: hypothetical protein PVJ39_06880 [Gammaproteobacteria bacterium]|jgi:hypothetical protein